MAARALLSPDGMISSMILCRKREVLRVAAIKAAEPARTIASSFL